MITCFSRFFVFIVCVLAIMSVYFLFFLTPSPQPITENTKNSHASCGMANTFSKLDKGQDNIGVGVEADYVEFPWQAYIQIEMKSGNTYTCGGSLISNQWVLTAAHCLVNTDKGDRIVEVWVTLGMHNYKSVENHRRVFEVYSNGFFFHPDYNSETWDTDIALIKLPSIVTFSRFVHPVCLADWKEIDYVGELVTIAGWSSTFGDRWSDFPSDAVLYKMRTTVASNSNCRASFSTITDENICTKGNSLERSGACTIGDGDSGSPLIFKRSNGRWRQIGILSRTKNCKKNPSILYTRVSSYAPWIKHIMARSSGSLTFSFLSTTLVSINFIVIYLKMYCI